MKWTKDKPKSEGNYFYRDGPASETVLAHAYGKDDADTYCRQAEIVYESGHYNIKYDLHGEWLGPFTAEDLIK